MLRHSLENADALPISAQSFFSLSCPGFPCSFLCIAAFWASLLLGKTTATESLMLKSVCSLKV